MNVPWNNWSHCNGNTYGTRLRGDPRGFRERHHRIHVAGDYRHPPPQGRYDRLQARSQKLMKRAPIHLNPEQRAIALRAMVEKLQQDQIEVIAVAVDDHHFHVLARVPDHRPKHWIGRAKMNASFILSDHGLKGTV